MISFVSRRGAKSRFFLFKAYLFVFVFGSKVWFDGMMGDTVGDWVRPQQRRAAYETYEILSLFIIY